MRNVNAYAHGAETVLSVEIPGTPVGQGSMVNGHHGPSTTKHRKLAIEILKDHAPPQPYRGAVFAVAAMYYSRPAAHYLPANRSRPRPALRPDAPMWHTGARDVDKCIRLLGDALTFAGVLADDGQIVEWTASKHWTEGAAHTLIELTYVTAGGRSAPGGSDRSGTATARSAS